jgi:hypothetical protein
MRIELVGFNEVDKLPTMEAAYVDAQFAVHQGISEGQAFTSGTRTAQYATELTFTALRRTGIIPQEGIYIDAFQAVVNHIADETLRH